VGNGEARGDGSSLWRWLYYLALLLVFAAGAYLRFDGLGEPALWRDEIYHVQVAEQLQQLPLQRWILRIPNDLENGPVYYGTQILGLSLRKGEAGARLFPAVFGLLMLPAMAVAGHLLGGRLLSVVAALLLAISPLHVYYSREGRPYALLMLIAVLLLIALLQKGSRSGVVLAYVGCVVGAFAAVHFIPILGSFGVLTVLILLWSGWRSSPSLKQLPGHLVRSPMRHYLLAGLIGLGLVTFLYVGRSTNYAPDFVVQQAPVYIPPLSVRALRRFAASMTTTGLGGGGVGWQSWAMISLALFGLTIGQVRRPMRTVSTAGMFVLPAVLSVFLLVSVGRWYGVRYTCTALPAFLLLVAAGMVAVSKALPRLLPRRPSVRWQGALSWVSAAAIVGMVAGPNVAAARVEPYQKLDWREIARFFEENALDGESIIVPNHWPMLCLGYYLQNSSMRLPLVNVRESVARAEEVLSTLDRAWLLTAGYRYTGEVRAWMHRFDPVLKRSLEELALFFYPDISTLFESRFAADQGSFFARQFEMLNGRLEFDGAEMALLGAGWSYRESNREGISYQWALGAETEIGMPVMAPRDLVIRFRVLPLSYPGATPQTIEVQLNSQTLANVELSGGWSEHEVFAPSSTWQVGANVLTLRFGRSAVPASVVAGSSDRRNLSAAFDFLEVRDSD